jgi:hypothetical protein
MTEFNYNPRTGLLTLVDRVGNLEEIIKAVEIEKDLTAEQLCLKLAEAMNDKADYQKN